jgi:LmbE family N-acetylglucosaminyl deacetylase
MNWVYLSPHLDDAALSCGGLIWEQSQAGEPVSIWTICAGDPPEGPPSDFAQSLHARWGSGQQAAASRRLEDLSSCQALQATCRHFTFPDCIYRRAPGTQRSLYASEQALFSPLDPAERPVVDRLSSELALGLPAHTKLVIPLALGGHVDHRLTRLAAERLPRQDMRIYYYADYPYVLKAKAELAALAETGWTARIFSVTQAGMAAWQASIAAHTSQISTFWPGLDAMCSAIEAYREETGGVQLWESP